MSGWTAALVIGLAALADAVTAAVLWLSLRHRGWWP